MNQIAIVGATSHIAKGLIISFLNNSNDLLYLFARNKDAVKYFLKSNNKNVEKIQINLFESFNCFKYDLIINCIGIADPAKLKQSGGNIFFLTESFDNMIIDYLKTHNETLYINFSSGAVYGTDFSIPVNNFSKSEIMVNSINDNDYYRIAKLNTEAKHRSLKKLNIVDLRVFSYFSRFIDLKTNYLMTEIVNSIKRNSIFLTNDVNIVRDYIHLDDLFLLVNCCINKKNINDVFDVYSKSPVEKFDMLDVFESRYNLKYQLTDSFSPVTATGSKNFYFSENRHAESIGFSPKYSSIETLVAEVEKILNNYN